MRISFDVPESIVRELLEPVPLPNVLRVRYDIPTPEPIDDLATVLREALAGSDALSTVQPGNRIAIAIGSRGIDRLPEIARGLVQDLRARGAHPFIVPAMGSHGGATAEGQRLVLEHLGVTPDGAGAPIESQMETVVVGQTVDETPVRIDRLAFAADGIVTVARVKPHTAFHGAYESGLAKMLAIGLGKQAGAAITHARGFGEMARMVPAMAEVVLQRAPILCAVAVLENAYDRIFRLEVVPAHRTLEEEPVLLDLARTAMPRIPYEQLDVLVIDEIGKDISGDGADPNVTGRYPTPFATGGPDVNKQVVLDLTEASGGNANGVGTADFTTTRLARKMDLGRTYPNALTSTVAGPVKLPMVLPSDKLAIAAAVLTCNAVGREPRLMRIKNTLQLREFWASTALSEEIERDPVQHPISEAAPFEFDEAGNLPDVEGRARAGPTASPQEYDVW